MSNIHDQNWCLRKEAQFNDRSQLQASKGKSIILTASDHQALVAEGI